MNNILENVATIEKVKVGMWVHSVINGWGQVFGVRPGNFSPIEVKYPNGTAFGYTVEGKTCKTDVNPSLFLIDIFQGMRPPEPEIDWLQACAMVAPIFDCSFWETGEYDPDDIVKGTLVAYLTDIPDNEFPFVAYIEEVGYRRFKHCKLSPSVTVSPEWVREGR